MDNFKNEISFPRSGMSKGTDPRNLKENEYTHALNVNLNSVDGDYIDLSYEKSNVLSVNFPEGFSVIGKFNRLLNDRTYYFLHNKITKKNKFGYVDNKVVFEENEPFKTFITLLEDECTEEGFNFRIDKPIKNPLLKEQKTGGIIYFTDGFNPPKYIELDNIETYFIDEEPCEDDIRVTCPLFDKMLIHKKYKLPQISQSTVTNGGSLNKGSYSFIVALTDSMGNEVSEYFSVTQPTDVWEVGEGKQSSKAIRVTLNDLDTNFTHYKLIAIYTEKDSRTTSYYEVGIYSINQTEVIVGDLSYAQRTSIEKLSFNNQKVETSEGLTTANNSLMEYGLVFEDETNLQPIVNLLGSYLEWQTHLAKEDLYEFGDMRSKYLGINRNEVVPYGIRFLKEGGTVTPIFPLVGREATISDRIKVNPSDKNRASYELTETCDSSVRDEYWQYHNTAKITETLSNQGEVEVNTTEIKECSIEEVNVLGAGSVSIDMESSYETVEEYLEENPCWDAEICEALTNTYPTSTCGSLNLGDNCRRIKDVERKAYISEVKNQKVNFEFDTNINSYTEKNNSNQYYDPFLKGSEGYVKNSQIITIDLYERNNNTNNNTTMSSAQEINLAPLTHQSNFKIIPCSNRNSLSTTSLTSNNSLSGGLFNNKITDNSQWFVVNISEIGKSVTITKAVMAPIGEPFPTENFSFSSIQRVSFFVLGNNVAIHSFNCDLSENTKFLIYKNSNNVIIKQGSNTQTIAVSNIDKVYFVVEQAFTPLVGEYCIKHATKGGYQVYAEDLETTGKNISYDSITINLSISYEVSCLINEKETPSCHAVPYQRGSFSYWESGLNYPDNSELYDSTKLKVKLSDIPESYRDGFSKKFSNGTNSDGSLKIKDSFNLTCKPIRHFKFPDNNISPFMSTDSLSPFGDSNIYPLGVTIDEDIINILLDIAKNNNLISEKERKSIYGYEIFRGNLSTNRSVVASGLLYDLRTYTENNKKILYPNYPYNSFGSDFMNQVEADSELGKVGKNFTFHSPETDYTTNTFANEIKIEGYQFGYSKGFFDEVEEHPKWVVLTKKAEELASKLASLEVAVDIVQTASTASGNVDSPWVIAGLGSSGTNGVYSAIQIGLAIAWTALDAVNSIIFKYAKYKQEWLNTIENLGVSHNFASYYFSTGHYNYLNRLNSINNSVRSIQSFKFIKDGRLNVTNRVTKEKYDINNIDREWSTFISVGDEGKIDYPVTYSNYDKESITYQGREGIADSGRSREIIKKIASSYVHLVDYNVNQHGNINSINWITTSYKGNLKTPNSSLLPIFGGDTYITRHTLKRKIPLFLTTAMGQSGTTAFEYKFYNNIGKNPLFYVNYKIENNYTRHGVNLPTIGSEYRIDNESSKKYYFVAPSKFYLYYYGIPSFLTETRINTNYREYGRTPQENFYPNVGDVGRWTQETNVKLREPNSFKYDFTYSNQVVPFNYRTLPTTFKKKNQDIVENSFNGVMFSLPDYNENGQVDPWLKFKPLDFYEFDTKYGKLKELKGIENEAVLARFEHTAILYNKVSSTIDDGQNTSTYLGGKDMFQRRTASFVNSELGFGGTQHSESLSCEYGHFYADNDRGQLIQIPSGGGNMIEISSQNKSGKSTNMREWFKRHLPYKLLNSKITGIEKLSKDNAYNYIGTTFGYDALHKRVLITKKDYLPISECPVYYTPEDGFYTDGCQPPTISCPKGYTYIPSLNVCRKIETNVLCPTGYVYDSNSSSCIPTGSSEPINYDGADVVFILHAGATEEQTYGNIKRSVQSAISTGLFENNFNNNVRYSVVKTNFLKSNRVKYRTIGKLTDTKTEVLNRLSGTNSDYYEQDPIEIINLYYVSPSLYSPVDLALESVLNNTGERTFNNTVDSSKSIGNFREGNIAKIVYVIGEMNTGMGELVIGDGVGSEDYIPHNLNGCEEGAMYAEYLSNLADQKGVKVISIGCGLSDSPEGTYEEPTPENNYNYYKKWFEKTVASTDCDYYFTRLGVAGFERITESVAEIIRPDCRKPIPVKCGCEIVGDSCVCTYDEIPTVENNKIKIDLDDKRYFKEVSWTIAYYPEYGQFSSFYSYYPNYYVNHFRTYETGRNDLGSLWSHNNTNKSFGTFYGTYFPMEVELIVKSQLGSYIGSIGLFTENKEYFNNEDFYLKPDLTFNKSIIYNRKECSGLLHLDYIGGHTRYLSKYPIAVSEMEQRIPLTKSEEFFNYNYFYNRVDKKTQKPFIKNDENELKIELDNISFNQGRQLGRLNGDYFLNRLIYDKDSKYCLTLKLQKSLTNLDNM